MSSKKTLLITGAAGFIGSNLLRHLLDGQERSAGFDRFVATDIRRLPDDLDELRHSRDLIYRQVDITDPEAVTSLFDEFGPDAVVHLAAMVTPPPGDHRQLQYEVDVLGTRHVIAGCLSAGTKHFVYTSSGAAYGYHRDNPIPLCEDDALRGNREFAYADHKRIVEEELARTRKEHPELRQLVFRVSTVLSEQTDNQITSLFEQPVVTGIRGADSPFCIISADDVVGALIYGLETGRGGIYNLTGHGVLTLEQIADRMGGRYLALPETAVRAALFGLSGVGLSPYGPEQVLFLKHRPLLDNTKLVQNFGYEPSLTSEEAFEVYRRARREEKKKKVVLITGAGGGLGYALAAVHGQREDRLVLFDCDPVGLERTYMMLRAQGQDAVCVQGDICSDADCRRAVDTALDAFGGLDILYNNAGIAHRGFFADSDTEEIQQVIDVNLMGAVRMTEAALDEIKKSGGSIAAISSVAGFAPLTGRAAYAASKHGLHGFFETLRTEVSADGVSVSLVCPGYLSTDFRSAATDGVSELDVNDAARTIVDGVCQRRPMILVGRTARLAWLVRRMSPTVFEKIMRRSVREEFPT